MSFVKAPASVRPGVLVRAESYARRSALHLGVLCSALQLRLLWGILLLPSSQKLLPRDQSRHPSSSSCFAYSCCPDCSASCSQSKSQSLRRSQMKTISLINEGVVFFITPHIHFISFINAGSVMPMLTSDPRSSCRAPFDAQFDPHFGH